MYFGIGILEYLTSNHSCQEKTCLIGSCRYSNYPHIPYSFNDYNCTLPKGTISGCFRHSLALCLMFLSTVHQTFYSENHLAHNASILVRVTMYGHHQMKSVILYQFSCVS